MHRYRLVFDDGHIEFIDAEGPTQAVALREGAPRSRRPHTMSDMTAMAAFGRPAAGLRARMGLSDASAVDEDAPLFLAKVLSGGFS